MSIKGKGVKLHKESFFINGSDSLAEPFPHLRGYDRGFVQNLREAGITVSIVTVPHPTDDLQSSMIKIADFYRLWLEADPNITLVKEVQDIQRVKQEQKVGMILCMQNSKPVWDDLGLLTIFKNLGMRVIQLTNNSKTPIGDGCYERTDCGLGDFGIKMVEEMNRIGLLIDLSHVGRKTSLDAIEISKDPVAFSHSSAKSLVDHVRNLTDEQIKAVAEKKGVVGITTGGGSGSLIRSGGNATIDDFLNHVDYVVNLVGADYVGVGIDFPAFRSREKYEAMKRVTPEIAKQVGQTYEEYARGVRGLAGPLEYPGIAEGLVSRGYSDGDIKKILGENFLRLFNRVWKPS